MPTVYCISGLGADHHIFDQLEIPGVSFTHLPWLMPQGDEALAVYADRMKAGIQEEAPVLLGVSFGGMMAIEIAKLLSRATVIIISSIWHRRQLPLPVKLITHLGLGKWTPPANLRMLAPFQDYFLGVETDADARLAREYRGSVDRHYLQWSIRNIAAWQNEWQPPRFYHLHGNKDKIFPIGRIKPTHVVEGGGHLMIHNKAEKINPILHSILQH